MQPVEICYSFTFFTCRTIAIIAPKIATRRASTSVNVNVIVIVNVMIDDTAAAEIGSGNGSEIERGRGIESARVRDITIRRVATATRRAHALTTHPQHQHHRRTNLSRSTRRRRRRRSSSVVPMTSAVAIDGTHALVRALARAHPMRRRHIADVLLRHLRRPLRFSPRHLLSNRANIADVSPEIRAVVRDRRQSVPAPM